MTSQREIAALVEKRADRRCEYCKMHQSLQGATFHVEHIVPRSAGGNSDPANLAWCCPSCNLYKSNNVSAIDPLSGDAVALFHPRLHKWLSHFDWVGYKLIGQTPNGRATIEALRAEPLTPNLHSGGRGKIRFLSTFIPEY